MSFVVNSNERWTGRRLLRRKPGQPDQPLRGGAVTHPHHAAVSSSEHVPSDPLHRRRERGMALALFATYFSVMGAKCALPTVLSMLIRPETGLSFSGWSTITPQGLMARQLTLSTMAVALGKLLLGPVIDYYGGIRSLQISLTLLAVLLAIIARCSSFTVFAVCWIFVDFIFSSCWAGCINAVHQAFPRREWAQRVGMLAAAARTGNAAAFSIFASVLHYAGRGKGGPQPWRLVFAVSAAMQVLPVVLLSYFGAVYKRGTESIEDQAGVVLLTDVQPKTASLGVLKRLATTPEFWLHFVSRSALMVFGAFLLFVPTLMSSCYGASSSFSAQAGSVFALGCLLSVTLGSQKYDSLSKRGKITSVVTLLGLATATALAQLGHMAGVIHLSIELSAALLFLWGFSFAIPFYIPSSLYALSKGGVESSATIADMFDFGGFALLAIFNGYVASIAHYDYLAAWIPTFQILSACSATSLVALAMAILYE